MPLTTVLDELGVDPDDVIEDDDLQDEADEEADETLDVEDPAPDPALTVDINDKPAENAVEFTVTGDPAADHFLAVGNEITDNVRVILFDGDEDALDGRLEDLSGINPDTPVNVGNDRFPAETFGDEFADGSGFTVELSRDLVIAGGGYIAGNYSVGADELEVDGDGNEGLQSVTITSDPTDAPFPEDAPIELISNGGVRFGEGDVIAVEDDEQLFYNDLREEGTDDDTVIVESFNGATQGLAGFEPGGFRVLGGISGEGRQIDDLEVDDGVLHVEYTDPDGAESDSVSPQTQAGADPLPEPTDKASIDPQ